MRDLVKKVGNTEVGKTVRVVVLRAGKSQTLKVTLGRREEAEAVPASQPIPESEPQEKEILGLTVAPLTSEVRSELGLDEEISGLVVSDVNDTSTAYEKGLRAGDVLTEASQQILLTIADLENRIDEAKEAGRKSLLLLVRRGGDPRFVALALD